MNTFKDDLDKLTESSNNDINGLLFTNEKELKANLVKKHEYSELKKQITLEKSKERAKIIYEQKKQKAREGIPDGRTRLQHERITQAEQRIELLNAIENSQKPLDKMANDIIECNVVEVPDICLERGVPDTTSISITKTPDIPTQALAEKVKKQNEPKIVKQQHKFSANDLMQMRSTSRADVTKLMTALNINLDLQLSKNDTHNLLACLLTCNDTQLCALEKNPKIPVAIKTVIKRIRDDAKVGNIDTIERLWDRIFGKQATVSAQQEIQQDNLLIPQAPVSREAYIILRDTYLGE